MGSKQVIPVAPSAGGARPASRASRPGHLSGWRLGALLATLLLVGVLCQVDRILPLVRAESMRRDLGLSDTQVAPERRGLAIGLLSMGIPLGARLGFGAGGRLGDAVGRRATLAGAGPWGQALATSLVMIGSGLLGPALGPLLVGAASDAATAAEIPSGLRLGLLIVSPAILLSGIARLIADRRLAASLREPRFRRGGSSGTDQTMVDR